MYSFSYLEPVCCSMSSSNCCFLTCIQVSQEAGQVVWYSPLLQNFPQFIVIHTVKGFGIVNKAEIDLFLELSCFFDDPADVGNLISGSSAFSKPFSGSLLFLADPLEKTLMLGKTEGKRRRGRQRRRWWDSITNSRDMDLSNSGIVKDREARCVAVHEQRVGRDWTTTALFLEQNPNSSTWHESPFTVQLLQTFPPQLLILLHPSHFVLWCSKEVSDTLHIVSSFCVFAPVVPLFTLPVSVPLIFQDNRDVLSSRTPQTCLLLLPLSFQHTFLCTSHSPHCSVLRSSTYYHMGFGVTWSQLLEIFKYLYSY